MLIKLIHITVPFGNIYRIVILDFKNKAISTCVNNRHGHVSLSFANTPCVHISYFSKGHGWVSVLCLTSLLILLNLVPRRDGEVNIRFYGFSLPSFLGYGSFIGVEMCSFPT